MLLNRLCELVTRYYPKEAPTLPRILLVWTKHDEDGGLARLLAHVKTPVSVFAHVIESFINDCLDEDQRLITRSIMETRRKPVTGYSILSVLCKCPGHRIYTALKSAGIDMTKLAVHTAHAVHQGLRPPWEEKINPLQNDSMLRRYGRDLTSLAKKGEFDSLSDRPEEMESLIEVLLKKQKRNAMLTGPAGVGKTALVELLSLHIIQSRVPVRLLKARVYEVSMGSIVAGTKYRGMFEERLSTIINTLIACQPAILFIDEAHLIWGAGRAEGSPMDAANILKPILNGSKVSVIGATTTQEYHRYITGDPALARRFQEVKIDEPDKDTVFNILERHAQTLEEHHGIQIGKDILAEVWRAAQSHLMNRIQPDKSVDLLESAAVLVEREKRHKMETEDLYRVLSRRTGRMISAFGEGWSGDLKNLEERLNKRIIGQEEAVNKVVSTLIARRYSEEGPGRPLGTFLFSGATGVGKTELARTLAHEYFGSAKDFCHIDLAEYSGLDGVHKLIGMPYGFSSGVTDGILTQWLQERSSGVVLFDEIEKAHPEVHKLLLGFLDEGRITSGRGEQYDVRRCVAILTTNVLTHRDLERLKPGFSFSENPIDAFEILSRYFPEEFLGRLDEIIIFRTPTRTQYGKILTQKLNEALSCLQDKGIFLVYDPERLIDYLLSGIGKLHGGVRDIMRLIERRLIHPIAQHLLDFDEGEWVCIELTETFYRHGTLSPLPI